MLWTFGESLKLELLRDAALQLNLKGNRIHQRWQFHHLKRPKGNMNSHTHLTNLGVKAVFASKRVQTDN